MSNPQSQEKQPQPETPVLDQLKSPETKALEESSKQAIEALMSVISGPIREAVEKESLMFVGITIVPNYTPLSVSRGIIKTEDPGLPEEERRRLSDRNAVAIYQASTQLKATYKKYADAIMQRLVS